jgi:hypothetical protein
MMLQWLRRRQDALRLAQADAARRSSATMAAEAYGEARERDVTYETEPKSSVKTRR